MADTNFRRFVPGIQLKPQASSNVSQQGDMDVDTTSTKINYHNGSTSSHVVTETQASQGASRLTNKDLEAGSTAIVDGSDTTKKIAFQASGATTGTTLTLTETQSVTQSLAIPNVSSGDTIVTNNTSATLTGKTLDNTTVETIKDANFTIQDDADTTKQAKFQASGITTGTTRTFTFPDANTTIVGTDATQTLTNKTLSGNTASNLVNGSGTFNFNSTGTITAPNATDTLVGKNTTDVLTNKTLSGNTASNLVNGSGTFNFNSTGTITAPNATDTLVGKATTDTLTNKTFGDAITGTQIATPSNPSAGLDKLYFKSDDNLYSLSSAGLEKLIGSGASLSQNFIGMSSSFQPTNQNDVNAEASTGNWATYASGTTQPTTMTGGSATNLTLSRTTTGGEVLNGAASFKIVKTANNSQGQGVAVLGNIPPGYRGGSASILIPFKIISGSLVSGDVKIFIEDVTNSTIIVPFNNDVISGSNYLQMGFSVPSTCTQLRVGFHFASTSATAVTFTWDDVFVGPFAPVYGPATTDWVSYTPTLTGAGSNPTKGTVTHDQGYWRRVGDSVEIAYLYDQNAAGSAGSGQYLFSLPPGLSADTTKIAINDTGANITNTLVGHCSILAGSNTAGGGSVYVNTDKTNLHIAYFNDTITYDPFASGATIGDFSTATLRLAFTAKVPIAGWSSNVTTSNSQVFNISSLLANGTRVTGSAPTALGQYRSYLRDAGANTFSETNGTPTATPTNADGIALYHNSSYASADASNQPSRYDIFVGKNKTTRIQPYIGTGRTGFLNIDYALDQVNGRAVGCTTGYDPTTGVLTVTVAANASYANIRVGNDANSNQVNTSPVYFDVIVSENALAVSYGNFPKMRVFASSTSISSSLATINYSSTGQDTFAGYSSGTYTVAIGGTYQINAALLITGTIALNSNLILEIQKNGTVVSRTTMFAGGAETDIKGTISDSISCVQGDTLRIQASTTVTGPSIVSSNFDNYFSLGKLPD